jgi:ribosomal protein S18 acetylase RimI-like enzyme
VRFRPGAWVGLVDDEIAGFAAVGPSHEPDTVFKLYALYVLPSVWGTPLGFELARAALGDEEDVVLWVLEKNERARRFYERLGFRADGLTKSETADGVTVNELRYRRTGVTRAEG